MTLLRPARARAYVNHGRWVADCPAECGCALRLDPQQASFACPECYTITEIEWPDNPDAIWQALLERPKVRNRNWFPASHELAIRANLPHGQTAAELLKEQADFEGA